MKKKIFLFKLQGKHGKEFICVEVLWPCQPIRVMFSAITLFSGQAYPLSSKPELVHIFRPETDNCSSWICRRERMTLENISWYFMINLHQRMLPDPAGIKHMTSWSLVKGASNWATEAGLGEELSCLCIQGKYGRVMIWAQVFKASLA